MSCLKNIASDISHIGLPFQTPYVKNTMNHMHYAELRLYLSGAQDSWDEIKEMLKWKITYYILHGLFYRMWRSLLFKLPVIFCPLREVTLALPAALVSGPPGTRVAQTNTKPIDEYSVTPRTPLAFEAFSAQYHALAVVWRACAIQTPRFIWWIGPWTPSPQKSAVSKYSIVCVFRKRL